MAATLQHNNARSIIGKSLLTAAAAKASSSPIAKVPTYAPPAVPTLPSKAYTNGVNSTRPGASASATEIPKEVLQKAAESALVSSFVGLSLNSSSTANGGTGIGVVKGTRNHSSSKKVIIEIDTSQDAVATKAIDGNHSKTSVFVKAIPTASSRAMKELKVYDEVAKELFYGTQSKGPKSPKIVPDCYLTHQSGPSQGMLFLENLKVLGFENYNESEELLDFNHSLQAIETLARFHAQSYFVLTRELGGKVKGRMALLKKFPCLATSKGTSQCAKVYASFFSHVVMKAVEDENPSLAFKLGRKYTDPEALHRKMSDILENEKYENEDFYVICHGDMRMDNVLFRHEVGVGVEPGKPVESRLIDLKHLKLAPLASDLVYFMLTSLSSKVRDEFEEKLLAFYCDSFEGQLRLRYQQSGLELKDEDFDIEKFHRKVEEQYRRMLEYGFYSCVTALPLISSGFSSGLLEDLEEVHLMEGQKVSVLASLENLEKFQLLAKACLTNQKLKERIVGVVKRLVRAKLL